MTRSYPFGRDRLNPDPQYALLRRSEPVSRVQLAYGPPAWLVTNYELTRAVLGDARFSRAAVIGRDSPRESPVDIGQLAESITNMDPPAHTRIRKLVSRAFTPRRVEEMRPRVQEIASGLVDEMMTAGPPADLVESFSFPLPSIVICELLGVPEADRQTFRGWADAAISTTKAPAEEQESFLHLAGYLAGQFAQRRADPQDDLLTWLVQARDDGDQLSETELLVLGMAVLVAGYETTARQIANMVYTLLTHPARLAELRARPELLPAAVEELLRFIVFASAINPRITTPTSSLAACWSARASRCSARAARRTGTRACLPARTSLTSGAIRTRIWHSATGRTSAWAPTSPAWSSRFRSAPCCPGCRSCGWPSPRSR